MMSNYKSAILFSSFGKDMILFDSFKLYHFGTDYIALANNEQCLLCRVLDEIEITSESKIKTVVLKTKSTVKEMNVIVIKSSLKSIEEADIFVKQFL